MNNISFLRQFMSVHVFSINVIKTFDTSMIDPLLNQTHIRILLMVLNHKENQMNTISNFIGIEKGAFTTSVDTLIKNDYMIKIRSQVDKRRIKLELTPKGEKIANEIQILLENHINEILSSVSKEKEQEIKNAIKVISDFNNSLNRGVKHE